MLYPRIGSWPYPQAIEKAGKACQAQTLQLIGPYVSYVENE